MHFFLLPHLLAWKSWAYIVVAIGMVFEGDIFLFTASFLTRSGFFDFAKMTTAVLGGLIIGDFMWYLAGVYLRTTPHFGFVRTWVGRLTRRFDDHLMGRTGRTIFVSKFMYGIHHLLLMRAGMLGMNSDKYIRKDFWASLIWVAIVGGLGWFSSASFVYVRHYLRFTEIALLLALLGFLFLEFIISRLSDLG
ncbi:MAG: hypothetical protein HYT39_01010 [Candidatus Sungbacteria bacterium]|nr:hypothetical protein [Candidatus Sungbacteria bacterium]